MNILPLVLLLLVIISVMSVERMHKFKNTMLTQQEYMNYVDTMERKEFNHRQNSLAKQWDPSHRLLSFRIFLNKESREKAGPEMQAQIKFIFKELIKQLYGNAQFYQELESKRPACWDEMIDCIMRASDMRTSKATVINHIDKISSLNLEDEELQFAFYRMLKGTIQWKERFNPELTTDQNRLKAYPSLLFYLNFDGANATEIKIKIDRAPIELLRAIFEDESTVLKIIEVRTSSEFKKQNDAKGFEEMFKGKQKKEISANLLDFSINKEDRREYY